jgi:hypothetical protein
LFYGDKHTELADQSNPVAPDSHRSCLLLVYVFVCCVVLTTQKDFWYDEICTMIVALLLHPTAVFSWKQLQTDGLRSVYLVEAAASEGLAR